MNLGSVRLFQKVGHFLSFFFTQNMKSLKLCMSSFKIALYTVEKGGRLSPPPLSDFPL